MSAIDGELDEFLQSIVKEKLENFDVTVHQGNEKGEGFLGEIFFVSLKHKTSKKEWNLVIKKILRSETEGTRHLMSSSFQNEIHYYTKIFPQLNEFQKQYPVQIFDNYAKCYGVSTEEQMQKFSLENLKFLGYEMHPKNIPLDKEMFEKIFKIYAHLHAASYAMRHHHLEKFKELTAPLKNNWITMLDVNRLFAVSIKHTCEKIKGVVDEEFDELVIKKYEKYFDEGADIFRKKVIYRGDYPCLLHGDCWSNNMMFKYDKTRHIEHIKLLDFQIGYTGSPVMDLSYSFYSGASKSAMEHLENLLEIYHNTLSDELRKYNCDPEKVYPLTTLKQEWKEYCPFGFLMGLLIWAGKCRTDFSDFPDVSDLMDGKIKMEPEKMMTIEDVYRKRIVDLVRHMYDNDFL